MLCVEGTPTTKGMDGEVLPLVVATPTAVTTGAGVVGVNERSFTSLGDVVSDKTLKAVGEMGFTDMMEIQYRSIRPLLEGR